MNLGLARGLSCSSMVNVFKEEVQDWWSRNRLGNSHKGTNAGTLIKELQTQYLPKANSEPMFQGLTL